jgi:hypothetical protein
MTTKYTIELTEKQLSIIQNASARSSVSGSSVWILSTTSLQNSLGILLLNSSVVIPNCVLPAMSPPVPGLGYQSLWMCLFASVMAASNLITGKFLATAIIC